MRAATSGSPLMLVNFPLPIFIQLVAESVAHHMDNIPTIILHLLLLIDPHATIFVR